MGCHETGRHGEQNEEKGSLLTNFSCGNTIQHNCKTLHTLPQEKQASSLQIDPEISMWPYSVQKATAKLSLSKAV